MTFLNVVIGYGIIASVMTTDIDLSRGHRLAPDSGWWL
jgi:glucan phosphoethanolaminetransferase (alkaline phosphatase superfamily)